MGVDPDTAWRLLDAAPRAVLATAAADGTVDLVPIVFHVARPRVYFAVDDVKPKSSLRLTRLANLARDPRVSVLVDHYDDDWSRLWWVRAKGVAEPCTGTAEAATALEGLAARYRAYARRPPVGEVVRIEVSEVRGWSAVV